MRRLSKVLSALVCVWSPGLSSQAKLLGAAAAAVSLVVIPLFQTETAGKQLKGGTGAL